MRYTTRTEVETIGRTGIHSYQEADAIVARQMSSYWLVVDPEDLGYTPHAIKDGFWESWVTLWISKNVMPGSVCVDIGANVGFYTFFLSTHGCKVYAFDPNPKCTELLQRSLKLNGCSDRVVIENMAVTDGKTDAVRLWEFQRHSMNTSILGNAQQYDTSFTAKATSLDNYFAQKKDGKCIDFVKIDAEGSEDIIWNGMQKLLAKNPNCVVLMEFVSIHYQEKGKLFLSRIMSTHKVTYIDYSGTEQPIDSANFFDTDKEDLRMIALRKK